jgi:hypothetical protein
VKVWVPASEIHRIGVLSDEDVAKLEVDEAERYRAEVRTAAAADTAQEPHVPQPEASESDVHELHATETEMREPDVPESTVGEPHAVEADTPESSALVEESPAGLVRAPVNVGRGSGRVELYRLEAGGELVQQIARRLDEWSVDNGRVTRNWLDLAYQVLGRPAVEGQVPAPARVAKFDRINERLVHDVLGATLTSSRVRCGA